MHEHPEKLDKRLADRLIRKGLLDEKTLDKQLKSLPDVASNAAPVEVMQADAVGDEG